jgi:hypothetical protein
MRFKARLINKEQPTLLIKKNTKLKTETMYKIRFIGNKRDEELTGYLRNFNQDYFFFKFVHKIMEAFGLEYQKDYDIVVEEIKPH